MGTLVGGRSICRYVRLVEFYAFFDPTFKSHQFASDNGIGVPGGLHSRSSSSDISPAPSLDALLCPVGFAK